MICIVLHLRDQVRLTRDMSKDWAKGRARFCVSDKRSLKELVPFMVQVMCLGKHANALGCTLEEMMP